MPNDLKQSSHLIKVRSLLLATFLLLSLLALASPGVAPVEAAPKPNPESAPSTAPRMVTTSITATIFPHYHPWGGYGGGDCHYSVDFHDDIGAWVDHGVDSYFAAGEMRDATPFVDGAVANWAPYYHWCYGRGDTFSFDLSSIPANAIVQSGSTSLEFINMMAGSNQGNPFYLQHGGGSTFLGLNSAAQFIPNSLILGGSGTVSNPTGYYRTPNNVSYGSPAYGPVDIIPASLVQTWVTNRTSGSLSVYNGFNGGFSFAARTIKLHLTYVLDTTPPAILILNKSETDLKSRLRQRQGHKRVGPERDRLWGLRQHPSLRIKK